MTRRERIIKETERALEQVSKKLSDKFEKELQRCLDDWAKRFPRHRFSAFQAHGMLSVEVHPRVGHMRGPLANRVEHIAEYERRGAIATLCDEVDSLKNWHCSLEFHVSTFDTGIIHSNQAI
ncbi:hypothetical protein ACOI1H_19195 [Loktanella sp. DJP18]|uniref:hypothetical protein n=1 Tax=Loktanella sp. DJP18 TaxID=3409788 RepID=UPI003BB5ADF6